jgi:hypothetical protein
MYLDARLEPAPLVVVCPRCTVPSEVHASQLYAAIVDQLKKEDAAPST